MFKTRNGEINKDIDNKKTIYHSPSAFWLQKTPTSSIEETRWIVNDSFHNLWPI